MEGEDTQSTHIIIQGDGSLQGFEADQAQGTYIMKIDQSSSSNTISEKNILHKLLSTSQDKSSSKSSDTTTEPAMAFEIIQEPLNGDTLFDYSVFHQEENRFSVQNDGNKTTSISPHDSDDGEQTFINKPESIEISHPISNSKHEVINTTVNIADESLPVSFSSSQQFAEATSSSSIVKVATQISSDKDFAPLSSTSQNDEKNEDGEIVKKTIVEAFVKMVVCRKITVQKVDSKTGTVLNIDVHTEEEEPVILGVDCVETTEDVSSNSMCKYETKLGSGDISSKQGLNMDGGLKFLSAVSEGRQKINPSLIGSALLQSSLPKSISKALYSDNSQISHEKSRNETNIVKLKTENTEPHIVDPNIIKTEILVDDVNNDSSADYVPPNERKLLKKPQKSSVLDTKGKKISLTDLTDSKIHIAELPSGLQHEKSGSSILLPKRRGRKRRWDKALGLAANLKTCQFCNKNFKSVKQCTKHMKTGTCISALFCYICSKPFSSEELLEKHIMSHGSSPKHSAYNCSDCRRSYRTKAGFIKHFRMGTCSKRDEFEDGQTGDFPCEVCGSRFSTLEYLKLHRYKVHENPKDLHKCPDCKKRFHSFLGFQRHRHGRPCTEPLKCPICGKTYKAKESFKIHMKHHKSEISGVTFDCDACGRSYMTQTALTKHKLSHTGVKPYKCETCGKEFAMRYQVKDHARMHTGERPYLCTLCGSAFSNKGHLGRHLRSHENGTLLRRGRPKKVRQPPEEMSTSDAGLKLIDVGHTLQTVDGQTIQVVDSQMFDSSGNTTPMIIQADNNTIIIAEGWPAPNAVTMTQSAAANVSVSSANE